MWRSCTCAGRKKKNKKDRDYGTAPEVSNPILLETANPQVLLAENGRGLTINQSFNQVPSNNLPYNLVQSFNQSPDHMQSINQSYRQVESFNQSGDEMQSISQLCNQVQSINKSLNQVKLFNQFLNQIQDTLYPQLDLSDLTFEGIKASYSHTVRLWEDPDFRCQPSSIAFSKPPSALTHIQWKRPGEICSIPHMFVDGATRMDVNQGYLGDCWLLAAVACLSTRQDLLHKVLPSDQSFHNDYAGIFRFKFWRYGKWIEVWVDDRLPTQNNQLIYMRSATSDEFWSALLEKAYAKLNGSYEALEGGFPSEALTDFTGGLLETFDLKRDEIPSDLFSMMLKAQKKSGLMGCGILDREETLQNGLISSHAYSVTDVRYIEVKNMHVSGKIQMVRVRNPHGNASEWKGPWSDRSIEWHSVTEEERRKIGLIFSHDGEFWMSFKDFVSNFDLLEICFLGPKDWMVTLNEEQHQTDWDRKHYEEEWRKSIRPNAGGCLKYPETFWTNPQYHVTVINPYDKDDDDDDDDANYGILLIALMQRGRRRMKREGKDYLRIGYTIYEVPDSTTRLDHSYFKHHTPTAESEFKSMRELSGHHRLAPGHYVIVPSTFEPGQEGKFILRIYTETKK